MPNCDDQDLKCWKEAVGYPKECPENDYDCWMEHFKIVQCKDVKCVK
jgi:hypothetical protein